ncbi:MAG: hypothetical protein IIV87_00700, partial [Oscillospiraceae bacterium]|nr:hypothetical protein [Oscillospiraceae bacterium]
GNEKAVSRIINELYRKGAEVVYEKSEGLHVSGHACQEELKIIHGLVKPKFFIPVHGEQRMLQIHSKLAQAMGTKPKNIHIGENGTVFELTGKTCKVAGTVPAGKVFVDGAGVGDVGSVVLRDRKHLAEDGMIDLTRFGELGREGVLALLCDSTNVERPGYTASERVVAESFDRQFAGCNQRIIVTTFASNAFRLQSLISVAHKYGRKIAVTGRSMENILKVSTELGYLKIPNGTLVDISAIKTLPKNKVVIISTGSQGENMSALYRMAFSGHKQVEIQAGDRVIISASAIPGNEKAVSRIINELCRKGADVVYDKFSDLHVSGHACQEELKLIHALLKPRFFIPVHGEQRHLQSHSRLAQSLGMSPKNIFISDVGKVLELTKTTCKWGGVVPAGKVLVDGTGVGDVGSVVLRDRKHLAQDGMIVVVVNISSEDGTIITGPDIITRGFVYVKESEDLMDELRIIAAHAIDRYLSGNRRDWNSLKSGIKNDLSGYLFKTTKRNPMILPVVMEI